MVRGLYTGAAGMIATARRTDVIADNLANVSTVGFKKSEATIEAFPQMLLHAVGAGDHQPIGSLGTGARLASTTLRMDEGALRSTGNPLDLALVGAGFFVVQTPNGEAYTRAGNFTLNQHHQLVTAQGLLVLGTNGPITVDGSDVAVDSGGRIMSDGRPTAQLRLVDFSQPGRLRELGGNLLAATAGSGAARPAQVSVQAGYLEGANVNPVSAMVELIQANRAYEADQKIIQAEDETLGKAVNQIGLVRA